MSVKSELLQQLDGIILKHNTEPVAHDLAILRRSIVDAKMDVVEKKSRIKNMIDPVTQCKALRADGERCSRKKKSKDYCGTHIKGRPHGEFNITEPEEHKSIKVFSEEINGIVYWIDDNYNVYDTIAIMENKPNPKIINRCEKVIVGKTCKYVLKN
jgi:hypothetical protein